ncbi:MAG TPA: VWA domain-containing protein [Acidobacteriota bacterium]|nr:VWA domain-containing protein [Acidobacteriota bacterium]
MCALLGSATGQEHPGAQRQGDQSIRVQVEMVSLPVVVTTREGRYITDLKKEDFKILEDGIAQEIAGFATVNEPISVALALDTSGSTEDQLKRIQGEAIRFVNLLRPDDSVAIISFADHVRLLEHFNLEHKKNPGVIRETRPGGLTALYEAVWLALQDVLEPEYGRKALVLFSDGVDNHSESVSKEETLELALRTEATIYCVYFDTEGDQDKRDPALIMRVVEPERLQFPPIPVPGLPGSRGRRRPEFYLGHEYMMTLAAYSGGVLFDASKMRDLGPAFRKVAQELSSQYSIGYYPRNRTHDGRFRRVEVRVNRPGLIARSKKGYFAVPER